MTARIYHGRSIHLRRGPTELESTLAVGVFFSAGVPLFLAFFGPRAISGFMLSAGLGFLFLGWFYTMILNRHFRRPVFDVGN